MNGRWSPERKAFLVRDLVRDYCQVYEGLEEQRRRFDHEGAVSYSSIRDLLGEAMRKGVFWRLKDTAHHLFRNSQSQTPDKDAILLWQYSGSRHPDGLVSQQPVEALIDWCVGYAFHECAKLREDAFQRQHYANRLAQLGRHQGVTAELYDPLRQLGEQTAESSARELQRILHVLRHGLFLLLRYLEGQEDNTHLARWLVMEEARAGRSSPTCMTTCSPPCTGAGPSACTCWRPGTCWRPVAARRPAACWNAPPVWGAWMPRA